MYNVRYQGTHHAVQHTSDTSSRSDLNNEIEYHSYFEITAACNLLCSSPGLTNLSIYILIMLLYIDHVVWSRAVDFGGYQVLLIQRYYIVSKANEW